MSDRSHHRVVILGTGTGVGKTHVTRALARALRCFGDAAALKPVESGGDADARSFDEENPFLPTPHPGIALSHAVSAHLAAELEGTAIELREVLHWVDQQEQLLALSGTTLPYSFSVIETAGAALSPLSRTMRNFELARALDPAVLVLVGPDSLGVLHAMTATLIAMHSLGRSPDFVVLSTPGRDASTGTNARELHELGICTPALVLGHNDGDATDLAEAIFARLNR